MFKLTIFFMNESYYCTIIKNSLINGNNLCYKIPDPSGLYSSTIQRPFDLFGSYNNKPLYIEVKFMKGLKSFNLKNIKDHQIENLLLYKNKIENSECWIILGCYVKPRDNRIYIFKDIEDIKSRRDNCRNILKKELETIPYLKIKNNMVEL